jgi:hypothetical protein
MVSIRDDQVQIALGRLAPDEQIVMVLTLSPIMTSSGENRYCLALDVGGVTQKPLCGALPQVFLPEDSGSVSSGQSPRVNVTGPLLTVSLLHDADDSERNRGVTLVIRNDGDAAAQKTHLALQFSSSWRLLRLLTSLGLVSVVDNEATVRVGRLDPGVVVAIHVRGWNADQSASTLCLTLFANDRLYQSNCVDISD